MQFKCLCWPPVCARCSGCPCDTGGTRSRELLPSNKSQIFTLLISPLLSRVSCLPFSDSTHRIIMKNQSLLSTVYASLVLSACFIQGYSLPQQRYSADEFGRKFGGASNDISNSIDGDVSTKLSAEAKEEGSLITTVVELALKFAPTLINLISGETGPSQTDRVDGIDLNVRDMKCNKCEMFMKLFHRVRTPSPGGTWPWSASSCSSPSLEALAAPTKSPTIPSRSVSLG